MKYLKIFVNTPGGAVISFLSLIALIIAFTCWIIAMPTHSTRTASSSSETPTPNVSETAATEDQLLTAILFSHIINQVCHDKKNDIWFMYIPVHEHNNSKFDQGWYEMDKFKYRVLENNSLVLYDEAAWLSTYVDITGLTCKTQPADPAWFK